MANFVGAQIEELKNIRYQTLKLTDNRRVSVGKADNGDFSIKIRRLRTKQEIQGDTWDDKIIELVFALSPEAFTALFHLSFAHYKINPSELDTILRNNLAN